MTSKEKEHRYSILNYFNLVNKNFIINNIYLGNHPKTCKNAMSLLIVLLFVEVIKYIYWLSILIITCKNYLGGLLSFFIRAKSSAKEVIARLCQ